MRFIGNVSQSPDVTIGLIVQQGADYLKTTLDSLQRNTHYPYRLLVIEDGADIETRSYVRTLNNIPVISNWYSKGIAACANILIENTDTPYLVLLHSGTYVTPGWLSQLIRVLKADPRHGMAGPSTNEVWNQQQVIDQPDWSPQEIEAYARRLQSKYGSQIEYLDELHSLCDFCYCFKREVVERIGYFDEGYGRGPCYEIDYNTRAAKAGYKCVWARGAYVHRFPRPTALVNQEMWLFGVAKKRYQSKFCGLKLGLQGKCARNFHHCLGEACEFFAPRSSIQIFVEKPKRKLISEIREPLVSCIMPTYNRRPFVSQAIQYFLRQDYHSKELIIVDDGEDKVGDLIPADERIRYIELSTRTSTGEKRNIAISESKGEIIAHWDDDDWYGEVRISHQVEPLLHEDADLTGLDTWFVYDLSNNQFWIIDSWLHAQIFVLDIHGGTILSFA